jgi:hypothetical protein
LPGGRVSLFSSSPEEKVKRFHREGQVPLSGYISSLIFKAEGERVIRKQAKMAELKTRSK